MKLAIVWDTRFIRYEDKYYSLNLNERFWKTRYLKVFDEIVIVGRERTVYTDPSEKYSRSDLENVHFYCVKDVSPIKRLFSQKKESQHIKEVITDCDAVIVRGWWGTKECRELGKNYLFEVISCVWDAMWNHSILGKMVALPYYLLQRYAVYRAPYVMYVSQQFLQRRYPTRGVQIGITDTLLPDIIDGDILGNRLNHIQCKSEVTVLGTCAAVGVAYKGQRYVIKALAILKRKGFVNFKYQMVGSGDQSKLRTYAEKLDVADQIEFLGSLPHDKVFDWLDSIDIYVQPSFQEGLSRAVVEAMSRALPCIVSDAGGNPELIEPEFVCKRHFQFAEQIAESVLQMDIDKQRVCAQRNYQTAQEFSPDKVNEQRILFMKAFVEKKSFVEV